jgi:PAS domain S-box-containing protein
MSAAPQPSSQYWRLLLGTGVFVINAIALYVGINGLSRQHVAALTSPQQALEFTILLVVALLNLIFFTIVYQLLRQRQPDFALEAHLASQLSLSEERLTGVLEIAGDAIISLNKQQKIILYNQAAEKIFGYSATEMIGKSIDRLIPDRCVQVHRQHVVHFGEGQTAARAMGERQEIFGKRQDGSEFPAEASVSRLKFDNDVIYTVILRDISERRYIEQLKDEFVSIVSHELRTPLTAVYGPLKILAAGLVNITSDEGQYLLKIAAANADRLVNLINDILDLESTSNQSLKPDLRHCHVVTILNEVMQLQRPYAEATNVELQLAIPPDLEKIFIMANHDRIMRVLINLLNNAIQFSPSHGIVWLRVAVVNQQAQFSIQDQGQGIPAEKADRIFDRFQQVDSSSTRSHEGTGLGLAICRGIIQQHQGQIWVESQMGEGSTFHFTIPLASSRASDHE